MGDADQVMEAGTADDDELLRSEDNKDISESGDEEEGEVKDKMVRPMSEEEMRELAKLLGEDWKTLALKLTFKADEVLINSLWIFESIRFNSAFKNLTNDLYFAQVDYFVETHKEDAAFCMLKNWQEQDEDANAANLVYTLEGLKLKHLGNEVFKL